jgi:hypothetical protein
LTIFSRSVLHIKFKQQVTVFALQQSKLSQVTVPAKLLFVVKYYAKLEVSGATPSAVHSVQELEDVLHHINPAQKARSCS